MNTYVNSTKPTKYTRTTLLDTTLINTFLFFKVIYKEIPGKLSQCSPEQTLRAKEGWGSQNF